MAGFFEDRYGEDDEGTVGNQGLCKSKDAMLAEEICHECEGTGEQDVTDLVSIGRCSNGLEEDVVSTDVRLVDDPDGEYEEGKGDESKACE